MLKFETKFIQGQLRISVTKDTPRNKQQREYQHQQKSKSPECHLNVRTDIEKKAVSTKTRSTYENCDRGISLHSDGRIEGIRANRDDVVDIGALQTDISRLTPESSHRQEDSPKQLTSQVSGRLVSKFNITSDQNPKATPETLSGHTTDGRVVVALVACSKKTQEEEEENVVKEDITVHKIEANQGSKDIADAEVIAPQSCVSSDSAVTKRMSLLEQKRLQWAAERAQVHDWNPWGRPGGGAPSYTLHQNNQTNSQLSADWHKLNYPNNSEMERGPLGDQFRDENVCRNSGGRLPPLPNSATSTNLSPSSLRMLHATAFATMGLLGSENHFQDSDIQKASSLKEEARRQWLEDLERQREEQRCKKLQEKSYYHKNLNDMNIQNNVNNNNIYPLNPVDDVFVPTTSTADMSNNNESPAWQQTDSSNWNYNNSKRTFQRGANITLDLETQNELTRKRELALEHNKAIRSQLEDRLRQKQEEKDRRRKEELEEEMRLNKEREEIEQRYIIEQQQFKAKQNTESMKRNQFAREEPRGAEEVVVEKKLNSHRLPDVLDGTSKKEMEIKSTEIPSEVDLGDPANVPVVIADPYVLERILTPTKYRGKHLEMRDFSVQTDLPLTTTLPLKKNKCTITTKTVRRSTDDDSDTPRSESSVNGKRIEAKHKTKLTTTQKKSKVDRPQWGANKPSQNYKSQSERYLKEVRLTTTTHRSSTRDSEKARKQPCEAPQLKSTTQSGKKTRSSAEHQRKLLAQEEGVTLSARRSPVPVVWPQSTVREDVSTSELSTARRQRRQWQSPSRDQVPDFYTDSPQLPDVRNVRRGNSKDQHSSGQSSHSMSEPFRSTSPPVPALRHKQMSGHQEMLHQFVTSSHEAFNRLKEMPSVEPKRNDFDRTFVVSNERTHGESLPNITERLPEEVNLPRRCTAPSDASAAAASSGTFAWQLQVAAHRLEILRKLSLVRQGLLRTQKEMDDMLASACVTKPRGFT